MRRFSSPVTGTHSGRTLSTQGLGRAGSHSSHASPSTISPSTLATAIQRVASTTGGTTSSDCCMGNGIIASDEPAPAACRLRALSLAAHLADLARALPRGPAGSLGQQPHIHDDDCAGAVLHGGPGAVHGLSHVRQAAGEPAGLAGAKP